MAGDNTENKTTAEPAVDAVTAGDPVDDATYQQMIDILKDLTDHTHIFYDDYSTACNCNCNCFEEETKVITDKGVFSMGELVGQETLVLCHDGQWRPALWKSYGIQKLFTITFSDGSKENSTANHRWMVCGSAEIVETINLVGCSIPVHGKEYSSVEVLSVSPLLNSSGFQVSEEVFCCEEPVTQTFTLASGIVTMNCTCCVRGMVW